MEKDIAKVAKTDFEFRTYVEKHLRRGDKGKLQGLLAMSYPTLKLHLSGVYVQPAIQSQVIEFFERRKRAERMAAQYVSERIQGLTDGDIRMPGINPGDSHREFMMNFDSDEN